MGRVDGGEGAIFEAALSKRCQELTKQMRLAGMTLRESSALTQPVNVSARGSTQLPLITLLQDLITCQGQAPHTAYAEELQLKLTFRAVTCCNGLQSGMSYPEEHAEMAAELVAALFLHVCWHGKSNVGGGSSTADKAQAEEVHLLVASLVSRRMAVLLEMFMPHLSNATVRTAVNHMAVGMDGFKSEEFDTAKDAASMLPLVHEFIVAILPHCNRTFTAASTDTACDTKPLMPHLAVVCDVLMLAIKTFESAVEVTLRYEIHGAPQLSRYHSLTMLSTSVDVMCLMTPTLLLIPQISSLLQSILHMEVVLSMSVAQHDMQSSPMLQQLLLHAESMVKALHIFLVVDGQAAMRQETPTVLVPDVVSLLVLVKSTLKACCLPQEGHAQLVKDLLLLYRGPGTAMRNLLQVLWQLLLIRPGVSVIGPRVQEIFTVCLQQREQWPQVFNSLMKCMPGRIAEQLKQLNRSNAPIRSTTCILPGISAEDQKALCGYQDKRDRVAQQMLVERQASRKKLPDAVQKALDKQADIRDASDLEAMLLAIAKLILSEASDALSSADKKEFCRLELQSRPATPLWDGQEVLPRPSAQTIDDGDNAPASWDQDTNPSMPAAPQGQHGSSPHTLPQGAVGGLAPLHGTASTGISLGSNECNQSGSISPAPKSTAASTAELEAKMAMLQHRIAAKKAATKAAAKARKASEDPSAGSSSKTPNEAVEPQARRLPSRGEAVTAGPPADPASMRSKLPKISGTVYSSSMTVLHSSDTHEGNQPASRHSLQQSCVADQQHSSSSTILPVADLSHSQADATASSCSSALLGDTSQSLILGQDPVVSGTASQHTQLVDRKQQLQAQIGTGMSADQLPAPASQAAVSGPDQDLITRRQCSAYNTTAAAAATGSLPSFHHKHVEAQNREISQAHLDPTGWMEVFRPHGSPPDAVPISSIGSRLSGNEALQAAISTPLPHQQQGESGPDSRPCGRSCADRAMAVTARRLEVMQSHMPRVLQDEAAVETHSNPKSVVPVDSEPADSRGFATPMDIDTNSPKSHLQSNQAPFGEQPAAAFGHLHCSSFPQRGYELHGSGPCKLVGPLSSAILLADDQSEAMDTDDSM